MEISIWRWRPSRTEFSARFVAMRNIQVVNFALGAYSLARAVDAEKHFLRQIFRTRRVAHHAVEEIDQRSPVLAEQKLEGRFVPGFHVQHQLDVGPGHGLHSLSNPFAVKKLREQTRDEWGNNSYEDTPKIRQMIQLLAAP